MRKCLKIVAAVAGTLVLVSCAEDFVVGDWAGQSALCPDGASDKFSITTDLTGAGELVVGCGADDASLVCAATMYASESLTKKGMWELQADFSSCDAIHQDLGRRFKDCQENGTDQLRCCNPDGSGCVSYARK